MDLAPTLECNLPAQQPPPPSCSPSSLKGSTSLCWKAPMRYTWVERENMAKANHEEGQPDDQCQWQSWISMRRPILHVPYTFSWYSLPPDLCIVLSFQYIGLDSMLPPVLAICLFALRSSPLLSLPCCISQSPGSGEEGMHFPGGLAHWLLVMFSHWEVPAAD